MPKTSRRAFRVAVPRIPTGSALDDDVDRVVKHQRSGRGGGIGSPGFPSRKPKAKRKSGRQWDVPIVGFDKVKF